MINTIKIENVEVFGWEHAIRGARNPMNSWHRSDSAYEAFEDCSTSYVLGENDRDLMRRLSKAGSDHAKYKRMITVYCDITAPLYWWKEADTYKVGTVANSCSTMHKIQADEFATDMFSFEHLNDDSLRVMGGVIELLNIYREIYNNGFEMGEFKIEPKDKQVWWQMIQMLPSSYNQKRTIMLNYEVLTNMYRSRKNHKLDEWLEFCEWIKSLPYSYLITGEDNE